MTENSQNTNDDERDLPNDREIDDVVAGLWDARWLDAESAEQGLAAEQLLALGAEVRADAADQCWIDALLQRLADRTNEEDRIRVDRVIEAVKQESHSRPAVPDFSPSDLSEDPLATGSAAHDSPLWGSIRWFPFVSLLSVFVLAGAVGVRLLWDRAPVDDASADFVAKLVSADDCLWGVEGDRVGVGEGMRGSAKFDLLKGVAKMKFGAGATVVVEGPASFGLVSAKRMSLRYGSLAVRTDERNKDFVVDSPDAAIVDLGTSFGVHCDAKGATEVSVFEGAVEVRPTVNSDRGHVLGLGASVRISRAQYGPNIETIAADDRFANLVEALWDDFSGDVDDRAGAAVIAEFNDAPIPGTVDTFYGSTRGRGWRTPWMAAGNPVGEVRCFDSLSEEGSPYLHMKFLRATSRLVAREYGKRTDFDPLKPHLISWKWRFDGDPEHFGRHFKDRVLFYGNSRFSTNTSPANSWLIRLAAADEAGGRFRAGHPMHWCFFDNHSGDNGRDFNRRNLVDSGMTLKPGVVYRFAVAVYPEKAKYDVAIRDDEQTVVRAGLSFRNQSAVAANIVHFGIRSEDETADMAFSLDSVRIEQFDDGDISEEVQLQNLLQQSVLCAAR